MFKAKAIVIVVALSVAGLAQAQAPAAAPAAASATVSPAKKELVARVLQLLQGGLEAMARAMAEQPAMQMMQRAGTAIQRLPAERREAVAREIEADVRKYADEAAPIVRERAIKLAPSTMGALLAERFSEDELRQVIAMLESPVNRKFQGMSGELQRALGEKLVAETRGEIEPRVRALEQTIGKRLEAPAAAASAPKAATPTASGTKAGAAAPPRAAASAPKK